MGKYVVYQPGSFKLEMLGFAFIEDRVQACPGWHFRFYGCIWFVKIVGKEIIAG